MTQAVPSETARSVGRRDWRAVALGEATIVGAFAGGFFTILWIIWNQFTPAQPMSWIELVNALGSGASEHLMGAFGIVATVQLACLIAIVTGQIVHRDSAEESKLRSMLSMISLAAVVAVAPAVLAVLVHAARTLEGGGLLLVAVPIYVLQLVISTVIGTFEVGDDETLLQFAKERRDGAQAQIDRLEGRKLAQPRRLAILVTAAVLGTSGAAFVVAALFGGIHGKSPFVDGSAALLAFAAGTSAWILGLVVSNAQLKLAARTIDVVSSIALLLILFPFYVMCVLLVMLSYWPLALPMSLIGIVLAVLTVTTSVEATRVRNDVPPKRRAVPVLGTVALVGTHEALKAARKEKAFAQKSVTKYSRSIAARAEQSSQAAPPYPSATTNSPSATSAHTPRSGARVRRVLDALFR